MRKLSKKDILHCTHKVANELLIDAIHRNFPSKNRLDEHDVCMIIIQTIWVRFQTESGFEKSLVRQKVCICQSLLDNSENERPDNVVLEAKKSAYRQPFCFCWF